MLTMWTTYLVGMWYSIVAGQLGRERTYAFITQTSGPYDHHCRSRRKNAIADGEDDEDDEDDEGVEEEDEEDEEEEEEDEDEEEGDAAPGPSNPSQPELTRVERRELKKKQAAQKLAQKQGIDEDNEDADLINPNHVEKISDLGSASLNRKER